MFAVIRTGGKQYKVQAGDVIKVEKLDKNIGDKVEFEVLLTSNEGKVAYKTADVKKAVCSAEVVAQGKADKVVVYKYKAKKNVRRKQGHRQPYTQVKILEIK